jgi:hypothetical protein
MLVDLARVFSSSAILKTLNLTHVVLMRWINCFSPLLFAPRNNARLPCAVVG